MDQPTLDEYITTLGRLSATIDPTASTPEAQAIKDAADELAALPTVDVDSLTAWVGTHNDNAVVLALAVGLTQERFTNVLRHEFDTGGWVLLARTRPREVIEWLDEEFDVVRLVAVQRVRAYKFGDVLVARAGTRVTAAAAGQQGRKVEDEIEAIAKDLRLPYELRTRFTGRNGSTAPADLVVPNGPQALIAVAAKGFDSTGSKLTDAVREIDDMATVRLPNQYVFAVIDGIGWKGRHADLERLYNRWTARQLDGMYTLATLDQFRADLLSAADRLGIKHP